MVTVIYREFPQTFEITTSSPAHVFAIRERQKSFENCFEEEVAKISEIIQFQGYVAQIMEAYLEPHQTSKMKLSVKKNYFFCKLIIAERVEIISRQSSCSPV